MRLVRGIIAFGLFVFMAGAALAASQRDRDDCYKLSGDPAIAACTRVIQDRSQSVKNRITALGLRAFEYDVKKDYNRSIADYTEVIRLGLKVAGVLSDRCLAYIANGQREEALKDCDEALRLEPGSSGPFFSRGVVYFKLGLFGRSIEDYDAALRINPKHGPALYGRGLAKLKKGDTASGEADIVAAKAISANVAEFFLRNYGVK